MAISRFAIVTDGFRKPGTVTGKNWTNVIDRALLIVEGYLGRRLSEPWQGGLSKLGFSFKVE